MTRPTQALLIVGALLVGLGFMPAAPSAQPEAGPNEIVFRVNVEPKRGGKVLCALYDDEDDWLTHKTFRATHDEVSGRVAVCRFMRVPKGIYAIAALHDENGNGEMDKNFIGLPQEGYACSRDAQNETIFAPEWDDAIFRHGDGVTLQHATMKY